MARDRWKTRTAFLFAAVGSAVGLGNLWRFPYLTYEYGGGAFLIPYLLALIILGIPLLLLEFAIGQKLQKGAAHAFKNVNGRFSGIGWGALLGAFTVVVYYAAVMAWSLIYFLQSFTQNLPWAEDAEGYFFGSVLQISDSIAAADALTLNWTLFAALAVIWFTIFLITRNGVKSVGKVVMYTVPLPVILLLILFIRGITLPGAIDGIAAYLIPDFSALLDPTIWSAAAAQIFFTLSLGFGIMIAYASYNKDNNLRSDAVFTAVTNSAISIFAGFVVFSILGFMANRSGVLVNDVVASGPGLAFVVFPAALAQIPFAPVFAALFFLMLLMLGIDSAFSLIEAVNTSIKDVNKKLKTSSIAFATCLVGFCLGTLFVTKAGLYYLDLVDHFVTNYVLIIVAIFEALAIGWFYGADKFRKYINSTTKVKVGVWWEYAIKYVIPIILFGLLVLQFLTDVSTPYEGYPAWALTIGWLAVIIPLTIMVIFAIFTEKNSKKSKN